VRGGARPQRHKGKGRNHVDRQPAGGCSGSHLSRAEARALFHRRKVDVALMRAVWMVASRARPPTPPMQVQRALGGRKGNKRQRRRGFVYTMHIMMPSDVCMQQNQEYAHLEPDRTACSAESLRAYAVFRQRLHERLAHVQTCKHVARRSVLVGKIMRNIKSTETALSDTQR
jgi:hypothetical protein